MNYKFLPDANTEMISAAGYYDENSPGLGIDFLDDINSTIKLILSSPTTWQKVEFGMRRLHLTLFPFSIIYAIRAETVIIVSVSHSRRRPEHWHKRIKKFS